ncbi:hypothetical protein SDC9_116906 [bioreactor metagenome]|uniref:Uncharacterized protein n=1 Tax=bioreactor metagenome TaxID=1076179 RepID=A0A645BXX0_9ZZZZ
MPCADQPRRFRDDDVGVQLRNRGGLRRRIRANDRGKPHLVRAQNSLGKRGERERLFAVVEHHTLGAGGCQGFRQRVRQSPARVDRIHMRRENEDPLRRLRNAAQFYNRGCEDDIHIIFLRRRIRGKRESEHIVSIKIGLRSNLKERRLQGKSLFQLMIIPFPNRFRI